MVASPRLVSTDRFNQSSQESFSGNDSPVDRLARMLAVGCLALQLYILAGLSAKRSPRALQLGLRRGLIPSRNTSHHHHDPVAGMIETVILPPRLDMLSGNPKDPRK
jgi:hypothetical protein